MEVMEASKVKRIRELNDLSRTTFIGAKIMLTSGINALDEETKAKVLTAFREFKDFNEDNDPHAEHDFCSFEVGDVKLFGKCDYYDIDMRYLSDNPSDPKITKRVWTIMLRDEY